MEKRIPHYRLRVIKALVDAGKVQATFTALAGGAAFNLGFDDIVDVVRRLGPEDFYKSMTTYANHCIWQDVYRPVTAVGRIYLKLMVGESVLIVSFKEL